MFDLGQDEFIFWNAKTPEKIQEVSDSEIYSGLNGFEPFGILIKVTRYTSTRKLDAQMGIRRRRVEDSPVSS